MDEGGLTVNRQRRKHFQLLLLIIYLQHHAINQYRHPRSSLYFHRLLQVILIGLLRADLLDEARHQNYLPLVVDEGVE